MRASRSKGLQVMGILETRNLDFRNVVLLSMNDDNFPGNRVAQASFIPYNLRAAFDLPTPSPSRGVTPTISTGSSSGQNVSICSIVPMPTRRRPANRASISYQLDFETGFRLKRVEVGVDVNLAENPPIEVAKEGVWGEALAFRRPRIAGDALSDGLFPLCRLSAALLFLLRGTVEGRRRSDQEVDAPMFGTILHAAAAAHERIAGEEHPGGTLRALVGSGAVEQAVAAAINSEYLQNEAADVKEYPGNLMLVHGIVSKYLRHGVVAYDAAHDEFRVEGLERPVEDSFPSSRPAVNCASGSAASPTGSIGWTTAACGWWTTRRASRNSNSRASKRFSTAKPNSGSPMSCRRCLRDDADALRRLRGGAGALLRAADEPSRLQPRTGGSFHGRRGEGYSAYAVDFERLLGEKLAELFDPAVPFRATDDAEHTCRYCDYRQICRR